MEFLKKQRLSFYFLAVSIVLTAVALGIYLSNASNAYFGETANSVIVIATVLAIVGEAALIVLNQVSEGNRVLEIVSDVIAVVVPFAIAEVVMRFVGLRVYDMAIIYGSELESGNASAWSAMGQAITGMVIYAAALVLCIAAAFMKSGVKKEG